LADGSVHELASQDVPFRLKGFFIYLTIGLILLGSVIAAIAWMPVDLDRDDYLTPVLVPAVLFLMIGIGFLLGRAGAHSPSMQFLARHFFPYALLNRRRVRLALGIAFLGLALLFAAASLAVIVGWFP
jgi:hypothetical protein